MHPAAGIRGVVHSPVADLSIARHLRHQRTKGPIATRHGAHALLARYRSKCRHACQSDQQNPRYEFGEILHPFSIFILAALEVCDLNHWDAAHFFPFIPFEPAICSACRKSY
jgi:hypothetical protein